MKKTNRTKVLSLFAVTLLVLGTGAFLALGAGADRALAESDPDGIATREHTERLIRHDDEIELTAEQEKVRREALEALPAPCCSQFTAATCCCECNMARATWGLAKHLIVNEGADADRVREAVRDWHEAINPDGFTGDACFTGGCGRAFADNGCGGMKKGELVY